MKNLSLGKKLSIVVILLMIGTGLVSWKGITSLRAVAKEYDNLANRDVRSQMDWLELRDKLRLLAIREKELILEPDPNARGILRAHMDAISKSKSEILESFMRRTPDDGQAAGERYKAVLSRWWDVHTRVRERVETGARDEAMSLASSSGRQMYAEAEGIIDSQIELKKNRMDSDAKVTSGIYESARNTILIISALSLLFAGGMALIVIRRVGGTLDSIVSMLRGSADQVSGASGQIASASANLSQAATEQAASLQETAASLEELTSMVSRNMENSKRAAEVATISQSSALKGKEVVQQMAVAIAEIDRGNHEIMRRVDDGNRQISEITDVIAEIGDKTKVINDIVFQTKLLSFNASVEAARAGEHGKGFAVVAEEVGNLAQMSGNAAKEIGQMLELSIRKVEAIVNDTKAGVEREVQAGKEKVEAGTRVAEECGVVLDEIVRHISELSKMSADISSASEEQAQGVQEINRAIHQLDQVTQTNAAAANQSADSAESLSIQAASMREAVFRLITAINGGERSENPPLKRNVEGPSLLSPLGPSQGSSSSATDSKVAPVVPIRDGKPRESTRELQDLMEPSFQAVIGAEIGRVPAEDDPRFTDV